MERPSRFKAEYREYSKYPTWKISGALAGNEWPIFMNPRPYEVIVKIPIKPELEIVIEPKMEQDLDQDQANNV